MAEPVDCAHPERIDGVCARCGDCEHDIILNGACYYCGSTDIDAVAVSPKPAAQIVPASRLLRQVGRTGNADNADNADRTSITPRPDKNEPG